MRVTGHVRNLATVQDMPVWQYEGLKVQDVQVPGRIFTNDTTMASKAQWSTLPACRHLLYHTPCHARSESRPVPALDEYQNSDDSIYRLTIPLSP